VGTASSVIGGNIFLGIWEISMLVAFCSFFMKFHRNFPFFFDVHYTSKSVDSSTFQETTTAPVSVQVVVDTE
jgi:hypothetical protein